MKKLSVLLILMSFFFVQGQKFTQEDRKKELLEFYSMSTTLGDVALQKTALVNLYINEKKDEYLIQLGDIFFTEKNFNALLQVSNLAKDSLNYNVLRMKAWSNKMLGKTKSSTRAFEHLLKQLPEDSDIAFQLAVNYMEQGDLDKCEEFIQNYANNESDGEYVITTDRVEFFRVKLDAAWENLKGMLLYMRSLSVQQGLLKNKDTILAHFQKAIDLDPNFELAKENKINLSNYFNEPKEK